MLELGRRPFLKATGALFTGLLSSGAATLVRDEPKLILPTELATPLTSIAPLSTEGFAVRGELRGPVAPLITFYDDGLWPESPIARVWFDRKHFPIDNWFPDEVGVVHRRIEFYRSGRPFRVIDLDGYGKAHGYDVHFYESGINCQTVSQRKLLQEKIAAQAQYGMLLQPYPKSKFSPCVYDARLRGWAVLRVPPIRFDNKVLVPAQWWCLPRHTATAYVHGTIHGDTLSYGYRLPLEPVGRTMTTIRRFEHGQFMGSYTELAASFY